MVLWFGGKEAAEEATPAERFAEDFTRAVARYGPGPRARTDGIHLLERGYRDLAGLTLEDLLRGVPH